MRLIDADALHKALFAKQKWVVHYGDKHNEGYTSDQVHFAIDDAPTVEVVAKNETTTEVVMCKDCKHRDPEDHKCDCGALERAGCLFPVGDDYFCSWGEKR